MKHLTLILIIILLIGCKKEQTSQPETNQPADLSVERFSIDTVKVPATQLKDIHFTIDESIYPELKGLEDESFQNEMNELFRSKFDSYVSSSKDEAKSFAESYQKTIDEEGIDDPMWKESLSMSGTVRSSFEILKNDSDILSIVQYFVIEGVGGGNNWDPSSSIVTCDLKNKKILNSYDLNMSLDKLGLINLRIKLYFDSLFPDEKGAINYPLVNESGFKKLDFGIQGDSVVLAIKAYPYSHASLATYIIPIDRWRTDDAIIGENENLDDFIYKFCTDKKFQLSRVNFPVGDWLMFIEGPCPENDSNYIETPDGCLKKHL